VRARDVRVVPFINRYVDESKTYDESALLKATALIFCPLMMPSMDCTSIAIVNILKNANTLWQCIKCIILRNGCISSEWIKQNEIFKFGSGIY
ncbi:MAG: hypothetical protein IJ274_04080, partial [Lachnospiraceae bacterium]|nr:hypothetical protein [Lachnospiraceae bacterium]